MTTGAARGLPLQRLLQLASPALPVGAYSYSQGLEWAVEAGRVRDEAGAQGWIGAQLRWTLATYEAPLVAAAMDAWGRGDDDALTGLNARFVASRETAELRAETLQMGHSLRRLLLELGALDEIARPVARAAAAEELAFPLVWAMAAAHWRIAPADAVGAYLWAWLENQVMAAVKCVPLGQSAGQRLLLTLAERIPALAADALATPEAAWSNFAPGLAIASSRHETQYSRLFRS